MNWLHACYSLGATLGPLVMTAALTSFGSWRAGYAAVAGVLAILSLLFAKTRRRWDGDGESDSAPQPPPMTATFSETVADPIARIQIVLFFVYTGLEVTAGQWAFTILTEARHLRSVTAGLWVTMYWASIAVGRVVFGFVAEAIGLDRLVRWSILAVVIGAALFALNLAGWLSCTALVLMGLGLAPIYPCTMTRTPQRLGSARSAHAIGMQVSAAMVGAAVLPSASGLLGQVFGLQTIPLASLAMAVALLALHEAVLRKARVAA
jgi:fucose permease